MPSKIGDVSYNWVIEDGEGATVGLNNEIRWPNPDNPNSFQIPSRIIFSPLLSGDIRPGSNLTIGSFEVRAVAGNREPFIVQLDVKVKIDSRFYKLPVRILIDSNAGDVVMSLGTTVPFRITQDLLKTEVLGFTSTIDGDDYQSQRTTVVGETVTFFLRMYVLETPLEAVPPASTTATLSEFNKDCFTGEPPIPSPVPPAEPPLPDCPVAPLPPPPPVLPPGPLPPILPALPPIPPGPPPPPPPSPNPSNPCVPRIVSTFEFRHGCERPADMVIRPFGECGIQIHTIYYICRHSGKAKCCFCIYCDGEWTCDPYTAGGHPGADVHPNAAAGANNLNRVFAADKGANVQIGDPFAAKECPGNRYWIASEEPLQLNQCWTLIGFNQVSGRLMYIYEGFGDVGIARALSEVNPQSYQMLDSGTYPGELVRIAEAVRDVPASVAAAADPCDGECLYTWSVDAESGNGTWELAFDCLGVDCHCPPPPEFDGDNDDLAAVNYQCVKTPNPTPTTTTDVCESVRPVTPGNPGDAGIYCECDDPTTTTSPPTSTTTTAPACDHYCEYVWEYRPDEGGYQWHYVGGFCQDQPGCECPPPPVIDGTPGESVYLDCVPTVDPPPTTSTTAACSENCVFTWVADTGSGEPGWAVYLSECHQDTNDCICPDPPNYDGMLGDFVSLVCIPGTTTTTADPCAGAQCVFMWSEGDGTWYPVQGEQCVDYNDRCPCTAPTIDGPDQPGTFDGQTTAYPCGPYDYSGG